MIKSRIAVAGALLAVGGAAGAAGLTVTPTVVSDYDWRGVSQTNDKLDGGVFGGPAFQLGANYGFENGVYVGAWGSNIDTNDADVEVDLFAGYAGGDAAEGFGYDVGANMYYYPGGASRVNFVEAYAGISSGMFSGKVWFAPEYGASKDSGIYVEGNVTYPLPANFSLVGHLGYSLGDGVKASYGDEYLDYAVGVGYTFDKFSLAAKYISTDADNYDDDKVVLSVSTTLPWGN
jgi:uncharacterized protein (TIGR02001 family)